MEAQWFIKFKCRCEKIIAMQMYFPLGWKILLPNLLCDCGREFSYFRVKNSPDIKNTVSFNCTCGKWSTIANEKLTFEIDPNDNCVSLPGKVSCDFCGKEVVVPK